MEIYNATIVLRSLDAFFPLTFGRHFGVLARLQKNVHSAERALLRFVFFMRKIAKFCCDLERFPELGTIFRKTNSCGPIVREFEPSSYQTQRYAEIWRAFFTLHVLNRFGMFAFWWTDLPSKKCPLPNRNTVGREPKNVKKSDV